MSGWTMARRGLACLRLVSSSCPPQPRPDPMSHVDAFFHRDRQSPDTCHSDLRVLSPGEIVTNFTNMAFLGSQVFLSSRQNQECAGTAF